MDRTGDIAVVKKQILVALLCIATCSAFAQASTDTMALARVEYAQFKNDLKELEQQHGHFIQTPNVRMHYLTWGKPSGVPLVWIHGTSSNAFELFDVADSLVLAGYHIIAIDFYGHGLTPIPAHEVSLYHVADDIRLLLDELKIKKAVIGGWSRGGSITTAFYDAYPERVLGLALEDGGSVAWDANLHKLSVDSATRMLEKEWQGRQPPLRFNSDFESFYRIYRNARTKPHYRRITYTFMNLTRQDSTGKWQRNPGVSDFVCETTAEQLCNAIYRPYAANSFFGASTHMLSPKIIYRNLHVPLLIFDPVSADDNFDFEKGNLLLRQQHPDLVIYRKFENTGHAVKFEHPHEFMEEMKRLLERVKK